MSCQKQNSSCNKITTLRGWPRYKQSYIQKSCTRIYSETTMSPCIDLVAPPRANQRTDKNTATQHWGRILPSGSVNTSTTYHKKILGLMSVECAWLPHSHQHGRDGVLDVAIGGSSQELPEAALRQLHRAFLLLLWRLQRRGGAAGGERCRWEREERSRGGRGREWKREREQWEEARVWNQFDSITQRLNFFTQKKKHSADCCVTAAFAPDATFPSAVCLQWKLSDRVARRVCTHW